MDISLQGGVHIALQRFTFNMPPLKVRRNNCASGCANILIYLIVSQSIHVIRQKISKSNKG